MSDNDNRYPNAYGVSPAPGEGAAGNAYPGTTGVTTPYGAVPSVQSSRAVRPAAAPSTEPHAPAWDEVIDEQRGIRIGTGTNPGTVANPDANANSAAGANPSSAPVVLFETTEPVREPHPDENTPLSFGPIARMLYGEKPRRVLAVSEDAHGILLVLTDPTKKNRIDDVAYFPYPAAPVVEPKERLDWIAEVVKEFTPDWSKVDLWVQAPADRTHAYVLELPDLKGEELDAVALLQASKQYPVRPDTMRFDYRTTGAWDASRTNTVAALGLTGDVELLETLKNDFGRHGVRLAGVAAHAFSVCGYAHAGLLDAPWKTYVVLSFSSDSSLLSVFHEEHLLLQRNLGCGILSLARSVSDAHLHAADLTAEGEACAVDFGKNPARPAPMAGPGDATTARDVEHLLNEHNLTEGELDAVDAVLGDALDRVVAYVERSIDYFERRNYNVPVEGIVIAAPHTITRLIARRIEENLRLPTSEFLFPEGATPKTQAALRAISRSPRAGLLFDAAGLSFTSPAVPNLLACPDERREEVRQKRITHGILVAALGLCFTSFAIALWGGLSWWNALSDVRAAQEVRATLQPEATVARLEAKKDENERLVTELARIKSMDRYPAFLATLSVLRPEGVYLTRVARVDREHPPGSGMPPRPSPQKGSAQKGKDANPASPYVIELDGMIVGDALEQELLLAKFLKRLKTQPYAHDMELELSTPEADRLVFRLVFPDIAP